MRRVQVDIQLQINEMNQKYQEIIKKNEEKNDKLKKDRDKILSEIKEITDLYSKKLNPKTISASIEKPVNEKFKEKLSNLNEDYKQQKKRNKEKKDADLSKIKEDEAGFYSSLNENAEERCNNERLLRVQLKFYQDELSKRILKCINGETTFEKSSFADEKSKILIETIMRRHNLLEREKLLE